jgi:RIO kinase 2
MSEYNVFVTEGGVVVFDWPQAVPTDHENARELLERDVENVVGYFERKYPSHVGDPDVPALADAVAADELDDVSDFLD